MQRKIAAACLSISLLAGSTHAAENDQALIAGVENKELFGYALRDSRWRRNDIQVCWQDFDPADAGARDLVRQAVLETWEANSNIRFTGWAKCVPMAQGIRISVADTTSEVKTLGRYLDARPSGMVLNFTFKAWSPENRPDCAQKRDECLRAIAVHEFGHALGFSHEQNRPDAPDQCKERRQGAEGDYQVTKYDPSSIMNYCNANWIGDGKPSKLDIIALRTFYGEA